MADSYWDSEIDPFVRGAKTPGGLKSSLDSGVASASAALNAIPAAMGSDSALREMREQSRIAGNAADIAGERGIPQSLSDIHSPLDVLKFAGGQTAAAAPQLGAVALGGLAAGPVGAAAAVAPLTVGQNLNSQYEHNQSFNIPGAIATGIPQAALNVVAPEARLFQKGVTGAAGAALETGSRVGNALVRGGATAASQGANMAATAELGEINKTLVDPNYDLFSDKSLGQVAEAAGGGAIVGGLIGAGHGVMHADKAAAAKGLPTIETSPDVAPMDQFQLLDSPTYKRQNVATDASGVPIPGEPQRVLDLKGGRDERNFMKPTEAEAGDVGMTHQDAIDGLTQMHDDLHEQLRQHTLAGSDDATIQGLNDKISEVKGHLDVLGAGEDGAQQPLFQKPDDPLVRMGTGLDTPAPAVPQPDAQIAPANPMPAPNPDAKLVVPGRPTVQDQLIAAQKAKMAGQTPDANQAALLRRPPEPVNPTAKVEVPVQADKGFQLTPDRRTFGDAAPRPDFALEKQEPNLAQAELPLEHAPDVGTPDTATKDLFGQAGTDTRTPWQTRMRMAWMNESEGKLQGFHKAMHEALSAKTPEDAAAAIREKADNAKSGTAFKKLDAVHRALTGDSLEEHATKEASKPVTDAIVDAPAEAAAPSPVVGAETPRAAVDEKAAPVAGEIHPAVDKPSGQPDGAKAPRKSQDQKRLEDSAKLKSIVDRLDTAKKEADFQKIADDLYQHAQTAQTGKGHDLAIEALHDPENGFQLHHVEQAELTHMQSEMQKVIKFSESKRHTAEAAPVESAHGIADGERNTGDKVVGHLATNAQDPAIRQAMRTVAKNVDLSKVSVERVGEGSEVHPAIAHALSDGADGAIARYPDGRMTVHMARDAGEEAVAHELVHAATLAALDDPVKAKPFVDLMNEVKQKLAGNQTDEAKLFDRVALGDVKEFVAYAATNPRFHELLKQLDTAAKSSLWDRFKAAVGKVLGLPKVFLDKVLGRPDGKSVIVSGTKARFDAHFERLLNDRAPEAIEHEAEVKFHTFSTSPEAMATGLKEAGKTIWESVKGVASKGMLGAMPTHVIVDQFKHQLRSLPDVMHAIEDRTVRQHELARAGIEVHDALQNTFKEQKSLDRLHRVIENAQLSLTDPRTEPMDRVQAYLKVAQEKVNNLPKSATPLERARAEAHLKKAAAGAALKADWNAMSDGEKKTFSLAVEKMKASMEARQKAANDILLRSRDAFSDPTLDRMRAEGADSAAIDQHIIDTYGKEFKQMDGAYAPLKRFGDWVVSRTSPELHAAERDLSAARSAADGERNRTGEVSKATSDKLKEAQELVKLMNADGRHRSVTFHESSADSEAAFKAAKAEFKGHDVNRFTRKQYGENVTAANGATIGKIMEAVGKELPGEMRKNVESIIRDIYVDSLPDGSFAQTQQERAGVHGYSKDFSRSILDSLLRDSFQISALEHSERMGETMRSLDEERRKLGTDNANNIHDTLAARIDASTNFKQFAKWEQNISQAAHVMYLGASPAFLLMNAAQVPMITMPMLHARFGYVPKVEAHLSKAAAQVWAAIQKGRLEVDQFAGFSPEEKQVLTRLQNLGILNMTQMHDTAAAARSSNIIDPKTLGEAATKYKEKSLDLINMPAQYIETVNRAASALAAYRLAREGGKYGEMEHGSAMDYAAKVVRDSHVDYSAQNNPAWMKNGFMPGSRLLFQFKKYWINMLSMVSSNMWDAFGHGKDVKGLRNELAGDLPDDVMASKQELLNQLLERRGVARQTLAGLYGMHFITTGAMGVPFAGTGIALANVMRHWYSDPEDHVDTETDLKNYLAEAFGTQASDTLFHGVFAGLMGMGISQRIGMGDLAMPSRMPSDKLSGAAYGKEMLVNLAGPTAAMGLNWMEAAKHFEAGDYERGTEKLLPKMVSDPMKAWRREAAGGEVSGGKMVAKTDERDALLQALGITPESTIKGYAAKDAIDTAKAQFQGERGSLVKRMAEAALQGDSDEQAAARDSIKEFNDRNPGQGLKITASDLLKAQQKLKNPATGPKSAGAKARNAYFEKEGEFAKDE